MIDGRRLSAWCAWDTLFLPSLFGKPAEVESRSPGLAGAVKLTVTPTGVKDLEPKHAHVSFVLPNSTDVQNDIYNTFCHFAYSFPSRHAADSCPAHHPATFVLSATEPPSF